MKHRITITALTLLLTAYLSAETTTSPVTQPVADAHEKQAFNPTNARLLCATDKWFLWQTLELIESTRQHRAQSYVIRFYRQGIGEKEASLAWEYKGTSSPLNATVLNDSTIVLYTRSNLIWITQDGKVKKDEAPTIQEKRAEVLSLYPDGSVVKLWDDPRTYFVSISNNQLEPKSKILLSDEATSSRRIFLRHDNLIAWLTPPTLHIVNLKEQSHKEFKVKDFHPSYNLIAFDGQTAVTSGTAFDATIGRQLGANQYFPIFAVRNHIGYYFKPQFEKKSHMVAIDLMAVDLASEEGKAIVVKTLPLYGIYQADNNTWDIARAALQGAWTYWENGLPSDILPHIVRKDGIVLWDSKEWAVVSWRKSLKETTTTSPMPTTTTTATTITTATTTTTTSAPAVDPAVMAILERLEAAGGKYPNITAELDYKVDMLQTGDSESRIGKVFYQGPSEKVPASFRIHFDTLRQGTGPKVKDVVDYAFDGTWLTVRKERIKQMSRYQVAPPGEKVNPLQLGKGPFPVPFGQKAQEVIEHFSPTTRPVGKTDPKDTDYLKLTTRQQYSKEFSVVWLEMWVDRATGLPVKIVAEDRSENRTTVLFSDIKTPKDFPEKTFDLPHPPAGWEYHVERFKVAVEP